MPPLGGDDVIAFAQTWRKKACLRSGAGVGVNLAKPPTPSTNQAVSGAVEIIAASQAYEPKANAEKGIRAVKKAAADATVADLTEGAAKKYGTSSRFVCVWLFWSGPIHA